MAVSERSFSDSVYRTGKKVTCSIKVTPPAGTLAYALEEKYPTGWTASNPSHGGNVTGGLVKIGVFFDGLERTFTYDLMPSSATTNRTFSGTLSIDGASQEIGGKTILKFDRVAPAPVS